MARRLSGSIIVDGTDHELWPQANETTHKVFTVNLVLDESQAASPIDIPDVRWGGECRVETRLTARLNSEGRIQVEGVTKLFEGASEDTDDLEQEQTVVFTVPRGGQPVHHLVQLRSTGSGGGDHAEIAISVTNALVEEP